jgi:CDP-diacylglycerol--serine O-phosphatidyltransferase
MLILIYTVCCALRLARFNLTVIEENESWKINFFEGVPSPAAAGLILLPLILSLSGLVNVENIAVISSAAILLTSFLMVSKIPTYSLKRILIPRSLTIFLLLGIGIYISLLIFYTFEILFFTGLIYFFLIPISFFHYKHLNKKFLPSVEDEDKNFLFKCL